METASLIAHIDDSIVRASRFESSLPPFVFGIDGMSSVKGRHLFNNLLAYQPPGGRRLRYLEVGSWKGSLFCSAIAGNAIDAVSIDNFSEFTETTFTGDRRHPRVARADNVADTLRLTGDKANVTLYERDMFGLEQHDLDALGGPFDVFLYDGLHGYDAHYRAFQHMDSVLADTFVALIDDYDIKQSVHEATNTAFAELGYTAIRDWFLLTDYGAATPEQQYDIARREWWNGYRVSVVQKGPKPFNPLAHEQTR